MHKPQKPDQLSKGGAYAGRLARLARFGQTVLHTSNLASLWHIRDSNTLYTTLSRYTKKGLFFRIHKGMYALKPIDELNPWLLGIKALHRFAYVSTETVLATHGAIQQKISAITLVSDISKQFSIGAHRYRCRKLNDRYLYNPAGIITQDDVQTATPERAVADMLYFNPHAYFDGAQHIDWQKVRKLQKTIGYPVIPSPYDSSQPQRRRT
ncbi:hypothetical protein A3B21_05120 [Candidatus Uhrbacteria bacterium RIFCSPLOWO2_01_FULL_47_24]|uniref:AbiEi antitoxin C-terminal domain-containing protein n=1 Tax=Candidatus Uhrbacteria bacterium RIFCSPLOWO2_01_FULL_47_24 TaxID=1802401 RepID=A0A1F7UWQ0_9BACT|nr:MAG: hypothetical protein A2753_03155 [Candidatus Uhrbacteria bacterium RIFCSPHIGHO2_01_FULL_47_11]OGL69332.1 MAG: hypothetical protein A3D58_03510 [Candidatus Uhrbacteria bacterium RIFCSPHIGHO2_02_FULL_46_47]OGL75851.1 MAG: hypothetical protein A3F52_03385 [Candidatus Uhrbacteria bacterium RIFCSPHIGHO2_12_FULL_47_11]OGL82067.1 MAG: hypothetical protein A3B21_05120 [Candidatus Uhrbacteria bacterium RIFCSPLOWO2_01_FULL_47_24]